MDFSAAPSRGGWVGLGIVAVLAAVELGIALAIRTVGPGPRAAVLGLVALGVVPLLVMAAYWTWGFFNLRYTITRDGVLVRWGASQHVIPMDDITHILNGRPYAAELKGWRWPGYELGQTEFLDDTGTLHPMLVHATVPPDGQMVLVTPGLAYAISPADRTAFVQEFKSRRRLGTVQALSQATIRQPWARLSLWSDPVVLGLIGAGILLNAAALAWITWQYPELPPELALRFEYDAVERIAMEGPLQPLSGIWQLPLVGLAVILANAVLAVWVHRRARLAALLLVAGSLLVQVAVWAVLHRIA